MSKYDIGYTIKIEGDKIIGTTEADPDPPDSLLDIIHKEKVKNAYDRAMTDRTAKNVPQKDRKKQDKHDENGGQSQE